MNKVEEELLAAVRAINTSMLASDGHTTISIKLENGNILAVVGKKTHCYRRGFTGDRTQW